MKSLLGRLIVYSIVLSIFFNIDHLNHAGGFVCGALLGSIVRSGPIRSRSESGAWQALSIAGVILVLVCFYLVATHVA